MTILMLFRSRFSTKWPLESNSKNILSCHPLGALVQRLGSSLGGDLPNPLGRIGTSIIGARSLKNDPTTAMCSIVVMTSKVQEQDRMGAFKAGADDFIRKPYNLVDLKNKVARFLQ